MKIITIEIAESYESQLIVALPYLNWMKAFEDIAFQEEQKWIKFCSSHGEGEKGFIREIEDNDYIVTLWENGRPVKAMTVGFEWMDCRLFVKENGNGFNEETL